MAPASVWCRPRPSGCRGGSSSCGVRATVAAAGRSGGRVDARATGKTRRREVSDATRCSEDTLTWRERAWLPLLDGQLPADGDVPDGTLVAWRELLEAAEDNWLVWYHRGVARHYYGDVDGAIEAWRQSGDNAW